MSNALPFAETATSGVEGDDLEGAPHRRRTSAPRISVKPQVLSSSNSTTLEMNQWKDENQLDTSMTRGERQESLMDSKGPHEPPSTVPSTSLSTQPVSRGRTPLKPNKLGKPSTHAILQTSEPGVDLDFSDMLETSEYAAKGTNMQESKFSAHSLLHMEDQETQGWME
jgi:hypothetical protein